MLISRKEETFLGLGEITSAKKRML